MENNVIDSLAQDSVAVFDAYDMFGSRSELHGQMVEVLEPVVDAQSELTLNPVYQGSLVVLLLSFLYISYIYREQLGVLFKVILRKDFVESLYRERSNLFKLFMRRTKIMGCLLAGLLAVRVAENFVDFVDFGIEFEGLITLIAIVLVLLVYVYRRFVIKIIAFVGDRSSFFKEHNYICNVYWTIAVMTIGPLFIFGGNMYGYRGDLVLCLMGVVALLVTFMYFYNSYMFFIKQRVSFLQWILYLCAVDFFPISLIAALWKI